MNDASPPKILTDGFAIVTGVISTAAVNDLLSAISDHAGKSESAGKASSAPAIRNLLRIAAVGELASSAAIARLIAPILGNEARAVRGILFDKTPRANWKVAWHQDLSIAVKSRRDTPGFGPWSIKAGVPHVQPPVAVLQNMLTLRLHLDDCDENNGPLRVLPGSHSDGVLSDVQIADWRKRVSPVSCHCPAGGAVLMRPLILHASSQAVLPRHRRVVHLEFAGGPLPGGLDWYEGPPMSYNPPP